MSEALEALEYICKILNEKSIDIKWLFKEDYNTIKQALQELDKHLDFSDGSLMSGFDYKGQQIVAMPLEEYDKLMQKDKALEVVKKKIVNVFKVVHYERENLYFLQINFNNDESRIIQLPLLEDEAKDIKNLLKEILS